MMRRISAVVAGDVESLEATYDDPTDFPNCLSGDLDGFPLEQAIYHGPIALVATLLNIGADPNADDGSGFPSLFASLESSQPDRLARMKLLLDRGADIEQRGVNDYTPLHFAVARDDADAISILLNRGADRQARTRIDHYETPLEHARRFNLLRAITALDQSSASSA